MKEYLIKYISMDGTTQETTNMGKTKSDALTNFRRVFNYKKILNIKLYRTWGFV